MGRWWGQVLTGVVALVVALAAVSPVHAAPRLTVVPVEEVETEAKSETHAVAGWKVRAKVRPVPTWCDDPHHSTPPVLLPPPRPSRATRPPVPRFALPSPDLLAMVQRFTC